MKTLLIFVTAMFLVACGQVNTGHRGVKVRFGEVSIQEGSLPEGMYFYNPFTTSLKEMNVQVQKYQGKANTYTKDVQQADITYVVNLHLDPAQTHLTYRDVGRTWAETLVPQAIEGNLKQVIGGYEAVDLVEHRGKATTEIEKKIRDDLKTRNIILDNFQLVNIQYQKAFEHAVEEKQVAVQKAIEEKNRTVQIQEQAKQTVATATASAESMRIRANALISNPKLVEYEAVQKWDGKLPQYNLGGNAVPWLSIPTK